MKNIVVLPKSWRVVIYLNLSILIIAILGVSLSVSDQAIARKYRSGKEFVQSQNQLFGINQIKKQKQGIDPQLKKIDVSLPGLSTNEIGLLTAQFSEAVQTGELVIAGELFNQLDVQSSEVLAKQGEIIKQEIERLSVNLRENLIEIDRVFGNLAVVPEDATVQLEDQRREPETRLALAREWVEESAQEIKRRRVESDQAQKQIVIKKSEKRLYMLENGEKIFSMPVSLGRSGARTRSGDFAILDKLGTVWSFWQIWLPDWMGIYFAGASENGIHGLPYDHAGNVYWKNQVGQENITFGCVMPNDDNASRLYEWAEVGIPVAIVQ